MKPANRSILTINGGSSSIRFALYQVEEPLKKALSGKIDRIGLSGTNLTFHDEARNQQGSLKLSASDHKSAANLLIDWLEKQHSFESVRAVGHRVVHGMHHTAPELITQELLDELHRIRPYDPDHLPREIELIETFRQRHPKLPQVACFDTAFHHTMPRVAKLLPIPRRFEAKGIQRYGFHGLSYSYLMEELARLGDPSATTGRVILAHLGNGASLAAVRDGKSIDTSMGFTPTAGLVMSTRSGDLDPGVAPYLARTEQIDTKQFYDMVNHKSGLLGVSETSPDMRDLLTQEPHDVRAAEAVALFCYQAKKWIGSFAAALGGLDTLVFAGGIGENAPAVRKRICEGLGFFGLELDETRNAKTADVISTEGSRITVRVIRTDEELMIARSVSRTCAAIMKAGHAESVSHKDLKGLHILIISDNDADREVMTGYMNTWSMRSFCASSGDEALKLLRNSVVDDPYELALLDLQTSATDGLSLARTIRRDPLLASVKLVMMTPNDNQPDPVVIKAAGIASLVLKPVQQERLLGQLMEVMSAAVVQRAKQISLSGSLPKQYREILKKKEIKILLAEDNRINQMVFLSLLQKLGYGASLAINGVEVLKALNTDDYDLIFMDCQMPEMDGYEATRQIRAGKWHQPRIIAITANIMHGDDEICRGAGMDDYMSKPARIEKLREIIERWLPR